MKFRYDTNLIGDLTIREVAGHAFKSSREGIANSKDVGVAASCVYVWRQIHKLRFTDKGEQLTVREFLDIADRARVTFTVIHRVNYMLYNAMIEVADYLDDRKLLARNVKVAWSKVERTFKDYQAKQKSEMDAAVWVTLQDYMRKTSDITIPYIGALETVARDYMIQHRREMLDAGQRDDIALLVKIQTVLMFMRVRRYSFVQHFLDFAKETGVDFTSDFLYADLSKIHGYFLDMLKPLGVKFVTDDKGDYCIAGTKVVDSTRYGWAWKEVILAVRDEDALDKAAKESLDLNETVKQRYAKDVAEAEEKEFNEEVSRLSDKFKVVKV